VVRETHQPKCSNCQRFVRQRSTPKIVPEIVKTPDPNTPETRARNFLVESGAGGGNRTRAVMAFYG
jgi:hypothetical protein